MRIACVYTVKNEEEMLPQNIQYHRHLGATDFFVFLDHSTDRTKAILQNIPNVQIFENMRFDDLLTYNIKKPKLDLELIKERFDEHNGIRQVLNANMALELCVEQDIDWLINIDTDELVCLNSRTITKNNLTTYLEGMANDVGAVLFRNLEVVPTAIDPACNFSGQLFKNYLDGDLSELPKQEVENPYTGDKTPAGWYWGHTSGKLTVRAQPGAYFRILTHNFQTNGKMVHANHLLHYNICSFRHFINKYQNFENFPEFTSLGRKVRPLRTLMVNLVNNGDYSEEYLRTYFKENILFAPDDIERARQLYKEAFLEISSVQTFFSA